ILRKAHPQLLRLLQMGQTRSLPFAQRFNLPLGHRALQLSGNSAAVESFAGSDHRGKYGDAGVVTYYMSTLTFRVPDELDRALERQSTALGISKSDLAREALKRYLKVAEFRTLRTKLVARAQAGGINTDEDVFEILKKT